MAGHSAETLARRVFNPAYGPTTGAVTCCAAGGVLTAAVVSPEDVAHGPVVCPFRLVTGLPCPGCGLTRSWVYAMHGRWTAAVFANPFGLVLLAAAVTLVVAVVCSLVRRRPLPDLARPLQSPVGLAVIALWLGFGVVRLVLVAAGTAHMG
jgi:Protein of unknown function (DUF2752)